MLRWRTIFCVVISSTLPQHKLTVLPKVVVTVGRIYIPCIYCRILLLLLSSRHCAIVTCYSECVFLNIHSAVCLLHDLNSAFQKRILSKHWEFTALFSLFRNTFLPSFRASQVCQPKVFSNTDGVYNLDGGFLSLIQGCYPLAIVCRW